MWTVSPSGWYIYTVFTHTISWVEDVWAYSTCLLAVQKGTLSSLMVYIFPVWKLAHLQWADGSSAAWSAMSRVESMQKFPAKQGLTQAEMLQMQDLWLASSSAGWNLVHQLEHQATMKWTWGAAGDSCTDLVQWWGELLRWRFDHFLALSQLCSSLCRNGFQCCSRWCFERWDGGSSVHA